MPEKINRNYDRDRIRREEEKASAKEGVLEAQTKKILTSAIEQYEKEHAPAEVAEISEKDIDTTVEFLAQRIEKQKNVPVYLIAGDLRSALRKAIEKHVAEKHKKEGD